MVLGLDFPPVSHLTDWPALFGHGVFAVNKVVLLEKPTQRKAVGDKATYLIAKKMVYMHGSPATITSPTGTFSGENLSLDLVRNKVEVLSPTTPTKGTYKEHGG